jgi:hypothetical protein
MEALYAHHIRDRARLMGPGPATVRARRRVDAAGQADARLSQD